MNFSELIPTERIEQESINKEYAAFSRNAFLIEILNALPYVAAILNKQRQIVFCNEVLSSEYGQIQFEKVIGASPGEFLGCVNANNNTGG